MTVSTRPTSLLTIQSPNHRNLHNENGLSLLTAIRRVLFAISLVQVNQGEQLQIIQSTQVQAQDQDLNHELVRTGCPSYTEYIYHETKSRVLCVIEIETARIR